MLVYNKDVHKTQTNHIFAENSFKIIFIIAIVTLKL